MIWAMSRQSWMFSNPIDIGSNFLAVGADSPPPDLPLAEPEEIFAGLFSGAETDSSKWIESSLFAAEGSSTSLDEFLSLKQIGLEECSAADTPPATVPTTVSTGSREGGAYAEIGIEAQLQ